MANRKVGCAAVGLAAIVCGVGVSRALSYPSDEVQWRWEGGDWTSWHSQMEIECKDHGHLPVMEIDHYGPLRRLVVFTSHKELVFRTNPRTHERRMGCARDGF